MNEYSSIHRLFVDIHDFIVDYIKLIAHIHENSKASSKNFMMIDLTGTDFLLPASFNEYAIRANELRNNLKIHIKNLVQQRRKNISKDINEDDRLLDSQNQFNNEHKYDLKQLQKNISDENISRTVHCIRIIIDSFELFDSIQINDYFGHVTFRLVPILKHIQKQLCCIVITIQKFLDDNSHSIEKHLRNIQEKMNSYEINMKNKLTKYISRDIRPPVLVIPCPTNRSSAEVFTQMK